jgi:hypothetical protein
MELKYLDALPAYTERKVNLGTNMGRRSPLLNKFSDELFAALLVRIQRTSWLI